MNQRLQKKCLIASAGFHLLLIVILFVGPAFLAGNDKAEDLQVLDIIPPTAIEGNHAGGGNPHAAPPPPTPKVEQQTPTAPTPPAKAPDPEPEKVVKPPKPEPDDAPAPSNKPRRPQVSLVERVRRPSNSTSRNTTTSRTSSSSESNSAARTAFNNSLNSLRANLSPGTVVDTTSDYGPGGGGPAYAGYKQIIGSIYYQAWVVPEESDANTSTAVVSVTIARDGTVVSAKITRSSNNATVDRTVQAALDRVTSVPPFPEGAKEERRTFTINFNLKARQALG